MQLQQLQIYKNVVIEWRDEASSAGHPVVSDFVQLLSDHSRLYATFLTRSETLPIPPDRLMVSGSQAAHLSVKLTSSKLLRSVWKPINTTPLCRMSQ